MAWTYIKFDGTGEMLHGERDKFPPPNTVFLAFDLCRWKVVLAYREHGGYLSMLDPRICDDCALAAFAPLSERKDPDLKKIIANTAWRESGPQYPDAQIVNLFR